MESFHEKMNRKFDQIARPQIRLRDMHLSSFQVCGIIGLGLAICLVTLFVENNDLSFWVMGAISLAAVITLLTLPMLTKILTGVEKLVYYHHEIAVLWITALLLRSLKQPILTYLDATILGVGVFLACGRVGCLMVGCCHGRPHPWGVCYEDEHAADGFTPYLVGVRLFPIQLLESCWVLIIVLVGSVLVLRGSMPGEALAWYSVAYNLGRFFFEFMRGDAERPYHAGFSEPQWISVILSTLIIVGELSGVLPFHGWHLAATLFLVGTMIFVTVRRKADKAEKFHLLHARHILEVARAIHSETVLPFGLAAKNIQPGGALILMTSLGFQISYGNVETATGQLAHYTLSHQSQNMSLSSAQLLAKLILQLKHPAAPGKILHSNRGIYHLIVGSK
jgi:prolipoprotein diacylglyceryltransferase